MKKKNGQRGLNPAFLIIGSPGRARTADLVVNSHPLYQLSYRGLNEQDHINGRGRDST